MLRTIGKKFGNEAPDENPKLQKLRGDDSAGAAVVEKWLRDQGVAAERIAVHDGSGLSRLNLVSPEAIARSLIYAAGSKFSETLSDSLPVSGRTGTLRGRLKGVAGRIRAKTGSVTYVRSLAGYLLARDSTYVFVVIVNNATDTDPTADIDRVVKSLSE